jgi:hypothetical protein
MTPEQRAALREAAQAVLDTQGHDLECHAYTRMMAGIHPAAVLALLDECERMREALREIDRLGTLATGYARGVRDAAATMEADAAEYETMHGATVREAARVLRKRQAAILALLSATDATKETRDV